MSPLITAHDACPAFSSNLPTAPLASISLKALQADDGSSHETSRLFEACRTLGFFYLDLSYSDLGESILQCSEQLLVLSERFYSLPHEDKDELGQDKVDPFFAYRWSPCVDGVRDIWGRPGRKEMYSVSR